MMVFPTALGLDLTWSGQVHADMVRHSEHCSNLIVKDNIFERVALWIEPEEPDPLTEFRGQTYLTLVIPNFRGVILD